ncbi:MAG: hypothetical protein AAF585_13890 [Verrucomicrobiota bacterium]
MGIFSKLGFGGNEEEAEQETQTLTFKTRVQLWWDWFGGVAPRFYETIEGGKCGDLAPEVSEKADELFPGLAWVFGPGEDGVGHSFTLSPEGIAAKQFLTEYWLEQAPELEGWTFYDSRQPGDIDGSAIGIGDEEYRAEEVWVTPEIDEEKEVIHVTVWHPKFAILDEGPAHTVLFLWLDEALGERAVSRWVGQIDISDQELKGAMPLLEFAEFVRQAAAEREWSSETRWVNYKLGEPSDRALRADTIVGSSGCMAVVDSYLEDGKPANDDPVDRLGAEYVFVALDVRNLPEDDVVGGRGAIDDRIIDVFEANQSGLSIGGATGMINAYIDLLILDGQNSIDQISAVVASFDLPYGATIHPFYTTRDPLPITI